MKNVMISIKGLQLDPDGEENGVEFVTDGLFEFKNGQGCFSYKESELTGMEGTTTSFDISPLSVVMTREGTLSSRMVFEEGRKHNFIYDTPFGATTMGVNTKSIAVNLDEHGGDMEIDYVVDFQQTVIGRNMFKINVKEQREDTKWQI